jgi:hypothetical protein
MRITRAIAIVSLAIILSMEVVFQIQNYETAYAQGAGRAQIGTVDGLPIFQPRERNAEGSFGMRHGGKLPETAAENQEVAAIAEQSKCNDLQGQIVRAVRESQKRRFGVSVSPNEVAEASKAYWTLHDPVADFEKDRKRWVTYNEAASEVFDQHRDPDKVFQTLMVPLGDPPSLAPQMWKANLALWSTPKGRAGLARRAAAAEKRSLEDYKKGFDIATRRLLEDRKLDDAVDTHLAAEDPQLRTYLDEWRKSVVRVNLYEWRGPSPSMPIAHRSYLEEKREEFWQARYAEAPVSLDDPSLADRCQLGFKLGVKVAGSRGR